MDWYLRRTDGTVHGPHPAGDVRMWLEEGRIPLTDLTTPDTSEPWRPIAEVPELVDGVEVPPVEPTPTERALAAVWYTALPGGQVMGPYPGEQVRDWIRDERIDLSTPVSRGAGEPWVELRRMVDVFLGPPAEPPPSTMPDARDDQWYIRRDDGSTDGPYDTGLLAQWFFDDKLSMSTMVRLGGTTSWLALSDADEIIFYEPEDEAEPSTEPPASGASVAEPSGPWYVVGSDGQTYGPYPTDELRGWLTEGRLHLLTPACPEGEVSWRPLVELDSVVRGLALRPELLGFDRRRAFVDPPAVGYIEQADTAIGTRNWEVAAANLVRFVRLKGGQASAWDLMRDTDRLWKIVRRLARRGRHTEALREVNLVCTDCGHAIANFGDIPADDPVWATALFPASHWLCSDATHLREPEPWEYTLTHPDGKIARKFGYRFLTSDDIGLEFPTSGPNQVDELAEAKCDAQLYHRVLENPGPDATREWQRRTRGLLYHAMHRYARLEQERARRG